MAVVQINIMKTKPLTLLLALTFLFLFSCSEKEPKPKIETTKQEKLNETTFSKWDVALQGLIHTFSDSGKLLKSITYHEGIILSQKEYLNPPLVNCSISIATFSFISKVIFSKASLPFL